MMAYMNFLDVREADNWHYRGEGAANLVLAYNGSDPALIGKVLRLRKLVGNAGKLSHGAKETPILLPEEQILWAEWPRMAAATSTAELNHAYIGDVLRPLLGDKHVDPGSLVDVSRSFVEALNRNIAHRRPAWRAETGSLILSSGIGLLISDHSSFSIPRDILTEMPPTITVEIKPKCGFLPVFPVMNEDNLIKTIVSRFAMHQTLKLSQGKIKNISKYSPLDLFSGSESGIYKAICDLFMTPQNNLRIFCNGKEVFGEFDDTSTSPEEARVQLENVLGEFLPSGAEGPVVAFQKLISHLLFRSNVLKKLLIVQKLDVVDIEGSIQAYEMFLKHLKSSAPHSGVQESTPNGKITATTGSPPQQTNLLNGTLHVNEPRKHTKVPRTFEECRTIIRDFLISATAKDCGIMLTLLPVGSMMSDDISLPGSYVVTYSGRQYLHKVHLLDLDVKQLKKLPHYFQLDKEIVTAYRSCSCMDSSFSTPLPDCVVSSEDS
ncbi:inositol-pentakisphosphate 2-kinase [Marchantia polymorpha subsp. ruderalis]|uniref:Inositol-pentakisphosphate 2-kinase n=2 Tax=Marchantia polymorpha TaxID=3197 RepID=A0AAF6BF28_MARPO|nr:hypothetical protein MARPO_0027s0125 [Marchantia polymorpha]BBN10612.1 hypothetical protein Mp_5g05020 [Marchantia polymorpha subsp. ruderalis]|eukprot:PTQ43023.1 hypothetical protein MARPO_0027s0125 [Marchantia polymorpha]